MYKKKVKVSAIRFDFCRVIREIREIHHLTQEEMGDLFGVCRKTVNSWETKGTLPDANTLVRAMATFTELRDHIIGVTYLYHGKRIG